MTTIEITSKSERQLKSIEFYLRHKEGSTYESLADGSVQVVRYQSKEGKPVAAIFIDKKKDPVSHYSYRSDERRQEVIDEQVKSSEGWKKYKEERKARAKVELKVGDIIYTSWGYEQTNIDFYQVTKLVGKCSCEYIKIGSERLKSTSWCSANCLPDPSVTFGDVQRGRIGVHGIKIGNYNASKTSLTETHHESWGY